MMVGEHRARKRFGQNFLTDTGIIQRIVRSIAPKDSDILVEIGPGQGALTLPLLAHNPSLTVVELDRDLVARLEALKQEYPQLNIVQGDALRFDFAQLARGEGSLRVVGNLPYNISTPLIFHLLKSAALIRDMHFMLQKEVVERLAAQPRSKDYGRLSVMVQYTCRVEPLFGVPPECFQPRPKVDSAIVRLQPYRELPHPVANFELFLRLVNVAFQQRRKTLRNSLRNLIAQGVIAHDAIDRVDMDLGQRPEVLGVADFVALSNQLTEQAT